jgi:hypothetical protein
MNRTLVGGALLAVLTLTLAGCGNDDVKVYKVAKADDTATPPAAAPAAVPTDMPAPPAGAQAGSPQLRWSLPDGWTTKPAGEMRLASFSAPGKNGNAVDISIVPLPGMAGGDLNNLNRWRGQVGLDPISEDDLSKQGQPVTVGDSQAVLYDLTGTPAGGGGMSAITTGADGKGRILAVGLHRQDMMWFFKATGDVESVGLQKDNFISFLKSLQFATPDASAALPPDHPPIGADTLPPMGGTAPAAAAPAGSLPTWTVPAAWTSEAPSAMLLAKFSATENNQKAGITVSSFPGDVGGLLANVNRWRRQISLPPLDDAGLSAAVTQLTTSAGPASEVDVTGTDPQTSQPAQLVGVILPLNGQTWFYKLMGDATVVDHQKADFLQFVQSVKY